MTPANDLDTIRKLVVDEQRCEFFNVVVAELRKWSMDSDDLRSIIGDDLGEKHCYKSKPTARYFPTTTSDYYSIWVEECGCRMFIKLLVVNAGENNERLVVTSFKKDGRYV